MNKRQIRRENENKILRLIASHGWLTASLLVLAIWGSKCAKSRKAQMLKTLYSMEKEGLIKARQAWCSDGGGFQEAERRQGREICWILTKAGADEANEIFKEEWEWSDWVKDGYELSTLNFEKHVAWCRWAFLKKEENEWIAHVWGKQELAKRSKELKSVNFVFLNSDYTKCTAVVCVARKTLVEKVKPIRINGVNFRIEVVPLR